MTFDKKIIVKNLQCDNTEAAKKSVLLSGKLKKHKYLTGEEMLLPYNQKYVMKQTEFIYSLLGKFSEKQIKAIEYQGNKQVKAIKGSNALIKNMLLLLKKVVLQFYNKK